MVAKRVRAGAVYTFHAVLIDRMLSQHHSATDGQRVRVVNLPGAPRANTMNHCHIEDADTRAFLGMVHIGSLRR